MLGSSLTGWHAYGDEDEDEHGNKDREQDKHEDGDEGGKWMSPSSTPDLPISLAGVISTSAVTSGSMCKSVTQAGGCPLELSNWPLGNVASRETTSNRRPLAGILLTPNDNVK